MVDTTTDVLGLVLQTPGGNRNTWGAINNTNFEMVEAAVCGRHGISTTGGTTTLSQEEARNRYHVVSGTLLSDATVIVPNKSKGYTFINATSGDFAVLVRTASGAATSVPAGCSVEIICDGGDGCQRSDRNEVGQMAFFGTFAVPSGWFECNGALLSRAGRGVDLYPKIGETWNAGNGATTFGVPDAYTAGKFLRSRTASVVQGTVQGDQNKSHNHSGSSISVSLSLTAALNSQGAHSHVGANTGGLTGGANASHKHAYNTAASKTGVTGASVSGIMFDVWHGADTSADTGNQSADHAHGITTDTQGAHQHTVDFTGSNASGSTVTIALDGGTEARPTNLSTILCIKY